MNERTRILSAYVPSLILKRIKEGSPARTAPSVERFPSAILFADISGFTTFTEELDTKSPKGLEDVADILNRTFTDLIAIIQDYGGDVVKFAGDALWAIWPVERDPVEMICQALLCGQQIQQTFSANPETVSLRVSVSSGNISVMHVGGVFGRWEMIIAGEPLTDLGDADRQANPGEMVLSRGYPEAILEKLEAVPLERGCLKVTAIRHQRLKFPEPVFEEISEQNLRGYIPGAILKKLDAGQSEWLAEIRKLTTVFIRITGFDYEREESLIKAHQFMRKLQSIIYYYEGSLNRLNVDDKGTIMLAAFGLPPLSHEDDALRAIKAMWDIRREIKLMGLEISIGLTTGRAFCGSLGTEFRREYTMHGDVVNLAARLMQKASMGWGILCDENSMRETKGYYRFEILPGVKLKGRRHLSTIYAPIDPIEKREISTVPTVERKAERALISSKIEELAKSRKGGVIVLEGEAGIGKSNLLSFAANRAELSGISIAYVTGEGIPQSYPFYALQTFFNKIIRKMDRTALSVILREYPDCSPVLLNGFESEMRKIDASAKDSTALKKRRIREVLGAIFQSYYGGKSILFLIEDARWIDSDTWSFLASARHSGANMLFIIAARPRGGTEASSPFYEDPEALFLHLEPMDDREIVSLISLRLHGCEVGTDLSDFIMKKSEGYPHLAVEITDTLLEKGYIKNDGRICSLRIDASLIEDEEFPVALQGIVLERIDRLPPDLQLILKCASVVGDEFTPDLLAQIFPLPVSIETIEAHLRSLDNYDFIIRRSAEQSIYGFRNEFIRSASYRMLLFSQRQALHHLVAQWLEGRSDRDDHCPEIAHHLEHALDIERAYVYLIKAGKFSADKNDPSRAALYLNRALRMYRSHLLNHTSEGETGLLIDLTRSLLETGRRRDALKALHHILDDGEEIHHESLLSVRIRLRTYYLRLFPLSDKGFPLYTKGADPENPDLDLLLSEYYACTQRFEESVNAGLRAFHSMDSSNSNRSICLSRIALSSHLCGLGKPAGKYARILLESTPENSHPQSGIIRNLSDLALGAGKYSEYYSQYNDKTANGKKDGVSLYLAGRHTFFKGDYEKALHLFGLMEAPDLRGLNESDSFDFNLYGNLIQLRRNGRRATLTDVVKSNEIRHLNHPRHILMKEALLFEADPSGGAGRLLRAIRTIHGRGVLDPSMNETFSVILDALHAAGGADSITTHAVMGVYGDFVQIYEFALPRFAYYSYLFNPGKRRSKVFEEVLKLAHGMNDMYDIGLIENLMKFPS